MTVARRTWCGGCAPSGRSGALGFVIAATVAVVTVVFQAPASTIAQSGTMLGRPAPGVFSPATTAGGLVFVSALYGGNDTGALLDSDATDQTRAALEQMRAVLESAQSSLAQVVSVTVFLSSARDVDAMNAAYRDYFPVDAPARTTVCVELPTGARVAISAIAVPTGVKREVLVPAGWKKPSRPESYVVRAGGFVFLSGLVSRRGRDDEVVPGPVASQVKTILDNARILLKTAGVSASDVVTARVFLGDDTFYEAMNLVYGDYFPIAPPARSTAVVNLVGADPSVEITLMATTSDRAIIGPSVSSSIPLSTGVRAGGLLFLSGVLGNTDMNVNDEAAQAREALARIGRTLANAGASFDDVVHAEMYVAGLFEFPKVGTVYREVFPTLRPAGAAVGAHLVTRAGLVEMMMTAVAR